jgi:hypothetical protein
MTAEQLANDYNAQIKAQMATAALIKPFAWHAEPLPKAERLGAMARYLAAFQDDAAKAKEVLDYIAGNGMVRIL